MTLKREGEGMKDVAALFAKCGDIGADGAEGIGTLDGTHRAEPLRLISSNPVFADARSRVYWVKILSLILSLRPSPFKGAFNRKELS